VAKHRTLLIAGLAALTALIAAQQAAAYEWQIAKPGRYPGKLSCAAPTTGARVCFEFKGDKIWVKDTDQDALSAIAKWRKGGREGYCRNKLGFRKWGVCDTNFAEKGSVFFWAARYDWNTNQFHGPWSTGLEVVMTGDVFKDPL
jgi:hypothetical protein